MVPGQTRFSMVQLEMVMIKKRLLTNRGTLPIMTWEKDETLRLLKGAPGTYYQEADEDGKNTMRSWIREALQTTTITVEFTKADGTLREMNCTLQPDKLPTAVGPIDGIIKEGKQRKEPDAESLRVFDIDKQEWRSFRFDRLKKIGLELRLDK